MSRAGQGPDKPRAMVHRRILDVAESDPDASLAAIADEVSAASPDLVERVLDEYGDPGRDSEQDAQEGQPMDSENDTSPDTDAGSDQDGPPDESEEGASPSETEANNVSSSGTEANSAPSSESAGGDPPSVGDLSEKQRRTLRALYERPDASQGDLAEELDVTRATVSRRLNAIPGFEWDERRAFAQSVFGEAADPESESAADARVRASTDGGPASAESGAAVDGAANADAPGGSDEPESPDSSDDADAFEAVESTLADLEERVAAMESRAGGPGDGDGPPLPPELAHKVVHACMESDRLTEEEELDVLRALMDD
jgi:hypothetical protein